MANRKWQIPNRQQPPMACFGAALAGLLVVGGLGAQAPGSLNALQPSAVTGSSLAGVTEVGKPNTETRDSSSVTRVPKTEF